MTHQKIELVKNQPSRKAKVARSKSKITKKRLRLPHLSPAEQVEAERFKVFTQQRAAQQARVRELTETLDTSESRRVA